ncbi:hypothetical protein RJ639_031879 [Escallonia herrerae]|uniref:Uncharacterized protein n=1 Tax=Escallonia herrerae TaxID=1293975 RepID=A0AA88X6I2_9ASTE|nr:hypothetical protein RJ639_031879 [Escallonia herrerae]
MEDKRALDINIPYTCSVRFGKTTLQTKDHRPSRIYGCAMFGMMRCVGQPSVNIGNSDTVLLTSGRLLRRDIQDAIDIDIKAGTEFWDMPWCRWNSTEIKFSQEVVILGSWSFTLVHSKPDRSLVVILRGETLLHLGRNWCVPWNYKTHFTICIHSKGERCDIQKRYLINITIQDGSLNSSTVGNSLILVNTLAKFLTMEEIL